VGETEYFCIHLSRWRKDVVNFVKDLSFVHRVCNPIVIWFARHQEVGPFSLIPTFFGEALIQDALSLLPSKHCHISHRLLHHYTLPDPPSPPSRAVCIPSPAFPSCMHHHNPKNSSRVSTTSTTSITARIPFAIATMQSHLAVAASLLWCAGAYTCTEYWGTTWADKLHCGVSNGNAFPSASK
jgi:hypothetical protein